MAQEQQRTDWIALFFTVLLIIIVREFSVWLMKLIKHPELGNLLGLFLLIALLVIWRNFSILPIRMINANAKIMKDSAFAFLPVCGGAFFMLLSLGHQLWAILFILSLATLLPMWLFAKMAKKWL